MKNFLLLAAVVSIATPASAKDKDTAFDRVVSSGVLRCGHAISPPALVKDANTGQLSGMDYDVWEAIGRNLDLKIEWVEASGWGTFAEDLKQSRYDAFCSQIWVTPVRAKNLSVTVPVAYSFSNAYVRPDDMRFNMGTGFDNPDVKIPVVDGDVTEHMAKSGFPKATRLSVPDNSTMADLYLAVTTKKADVFFIDPSRYEALSKENPVKLKKVNNEPVFTFGARYSFAGGEDHLRDLVDTALQSLIDSGELEKITAKTSKDLTPPRRNYEQKGK